MNVILDGNLGLFLTVYNSFILTTQFLFFFSILLTLLFMYVTYPCELKKKLTRFVRHIFNSNDSVFLNYILHKQKLYKLYY